MDVLSVTAEPWDTVLLMKAWGKKATHYISLWVIASSSKPPLIHLLFNPPSPSCAAEWTRTHLHHDALDLCDLVNLFLSLGIPSSSFLKLDEMQSGTLISEATTLVS